MAGMKKPRRADNQTRRNRISREWLRPICQAAWFADSLTCGDSSMRIWPTPKRSNSRHHGIGTGVNLKSGCPVNELGQKIRLA
jgi:hypothetical protein